MSDGILDLIGANRLSATSAMVTTETWPRYAEELLRFRGRVAIGLHINLTFGNPLGRMPGLAPQGRFPTVGALIARAFAGRLDCVEINEEIERQFERFIRHHGRRPDFVDGHEHVHVLPGIRRSLLRTIASGFQQDQVLVRDPSDRVASIIARGTSAGKAMVVRTLATGFRRAVAETKALTNTSFAGFASFDNRPGFPEFERFLICAQTRHLIMCHPGLPDKGGICVPHAQRRFEEFSYLSQRPGLPDLIWHPSRSAIEGTATSIFLEPRS